VAVSERDRRHFERVRAAKEAERTERAREALERPAIARIIEGLELGALAPSTPEIEAALDRRALGQAELQQRARRLGLR
jgi:hypothetical protein